MNISLLEIPHRFGQVDSQLALVDSLLSLGSTDLAILPEAALTGYASPDFDFDLRPLAENLNGATVSSLSQLAKKHNCHLVGPLIEHSENKFFNCALGFLPTGDLWFHYRKRHPWYVETWATPGENEIPILKINDLSFSVAICFDIHFLATESAQALSQIDMLLFPSAWNQSETDSRAQLFQGLSNEFGISIANANWGIGDLRVDGQGESRFHQADLHSLNLKPQISQRLDALFDPVLRTK
jgi:5-aminopentanamidase